jgi:hypothetical protein
MYTDQELREAVNWFDLRAALFGFWFLYAEHKKENAK